MNKADKAGPGERSFSVESGPLVRTGRAFVGSDGYFQDVLDALAAAIYITDADGTIVYYNAAAEALWGHAPELGSSHWCGSWKLFWPDGRPMPHEDCPMAIALRQQRPVRDVEAMAQRPDGTRVSFLPYPSPLFDQAGELVGAVNMLVDITDRKEAAAYEQHLALVVNSSDDAIVSKGLDGTITSWNRGAQRVFGYTAEEAIGQRITLLFPAGREDEETEIISRIRRGDRIDHFETIRKRKDGKLVDVSLTVSPIQTPDGQIIGASKIARDITERRRAEHAALRLAAIVESSDDAILTKDLNGTITSWNSGAERLFGYTADEAIANPVTMLIPPDHLDEEPMILSRIRNGERIQHYETVRRRKDGSLVDISLTVSPLRTADGRIVGASKIARDITERRRARDHQDLLLKEMDHRIKNLFSLAAGLVRLSARSARTPKELSAAVSERLDALARAHALTLTRPSSSGSAEPPATLYALLKTITAPYGAAGDDRERIALHGTDVQLSPSAVTSLALLLHEFATNAAKYGALSTPDGHVAVHCCEEEDMCQITWKEYEGPRVVHPNDREGFGSVLSRMTVEGQLNGSIVYDWAPEGLTICLSADRGRLTGAGRQ